MASIPLGFTQYKAHSYPQHLIRLVHMPNIKEGSTFVPTTVPQTKEQYYSLIQIFHARKRESIKLFITLEELGRYQVLMVREESMQELSVSEQMMFSTLRLRTSTGSGTGFFFNFSTPQGIIPLIVTNKHVINGKPKETVGFEIHLDGDDFKTLEFHRISYETNWIHHPRCDLAACFAAELFKTVETTYGRELFVAPCMKTLSPQTISSTSSQPWKK